MRAIRIHEHGGPEKLHLDDVPLPEPGPGQVRLRVEAAGLNFIDTYQRSGLYRVALPATLGLEAAGVITAVGNDAGDFEIGDRVATARALGAYADETLVSAAQVVHVPDEVETAEAAALLLQGMTAHYLVCDTYPVKSGDAVLVHAAAGGVGLLLIQIAKSRGAHVIASVGAEAKVELAKAAGADAVIVSSRENVAEAVRRHTAGRGADVVYDSVGKDTFATSLDSLRPRGMLVSFGNASGPVPAFAPLLLSEKGSLFFTRPTLYHYTQTAAEIRARTHDLFRWIAAGELRVRVGAKFPLEKTADAHRALESRQTTGKVLILP
ncbi:MAG TPA: quinone oxidoreductase [Opitutaceae bacterium]